MTTERKTPPAPKLHSLTTWIADTETIRPEAVLVRHEPEGHSVELLSRGRVLWGWCPSQAIARAVSLDLALAAVADEIAPPRPHMAMGIDVRAQGATVMESSPGAFGAHAERFAASHGRANLARIMVCECPSVYIAGARDETEMTPEGRATWEAVRAFKPALVIVCPSVGSIYWRAEIDLENGKGEPLRAALEWTARTLNAGVLALTNRAPPQRCALEFRARGNGRQLAFRYAYAKEECRWVAARRSVANAHRPDKR